jgi:hypothetical protein
MDHFYGKGTNGIVRDKGKFYMKMRGGMGNGWAGINKKQEV